jgi:hypothetical protein
MSSVRRTKWVFRQNPRSLGEKSQATAMSKSQTNAPRESRRQFLLLFDDLLMPLLEVRVTRMLYHCWENKASRDAGMTAWQEISSHLSVDHDADDVHPWQG